MKSHLAIVGKSGTLALKPDSSVSFTERNPMFNDVEMFSAPFELPFDLNRHLMKNIDDVNSTLRASDVEGEQFRIIADGLPLRNTVLKVQDDVVLKDALSVNLDATHRTFKDMIQDMKCREVTVDDDILIGEKIGDVQVDITYKTVYDVFVHSTWKNSDFRGYQIKMKPVTLVESFQPPALGFSYPAECYQDYHMEAEPDPTNSIKTYPNCNNKDVLDGNNVTVKNPHVKTSYINVSTPYNGTDSNGKKWPYCNSRICYPHHEAEKDDNGYTGETSDNIAKAKDRNSSITEDKSPYWVLDANRPASGICFYVGYFLERLFKTLGVAYDMTALTNIEDFNYLAFFNTGCHYDVGESIGTFSGNTTYINKWLESRGCGGKMTLNENLPEEENFWKEGKSRLDLATGTWESLAKTGDHGAPGQGADIESADGSIHIDFSIGGGGSNFVPGTEGYETYENVFKYYEMSYEMSAHVLRMYANADNFPNANVSEVIESLENSFGCRFCYDAETNKVTVKLLRDMFRDTSAPIKFKGIVTDFHKKTEHIKGIRMKYSAEDDAKEQRENVRTGKRDYDTTYNYIDYPDGRTQIASYRDLSAKIDVGNMNGYADLATGNFYRIKVSADASTTDELQPAIFEVGQYKGVELGDCSQQAEDDGAIKEFVSQFEPIIVNDVAYRGKNYDGEYTPMLVPFIDEDMEHEFLVKKLLNPVSTAWGSIDIVYELCLSECYDPSSTDDGQSPLMSHDWGLTVGFLRPSRDGGGIYEYDRGYDGFDNSRWAVLSSDYAITADTMDVFGTFYGTSGAGSFSLKPRAWKPFLYYINNGVCHVTPYSADLEGQPVEGVSGKTWLVPCDADVRNGQGIITKRLRSRGMCDTWMIEFFHFLLNRQRYEVKALCTAAELADIPNRWLNRWDIDGKIGWINQIQYDTNVETGIGEVTIDFYAV